MKRYKEADANRFILLSELRRRGAHARLDAARRSDPSDPLDDLARMEARLDAEAAYADALDFLAADAGSPPPPRRPSVEDQLAELKRRMGQG